jgi:5-methylcytosine-specific restriction endonuclease McrA
VLARPLYAPILAIPQATCYMGGVLRSCNQTVMPSVMKTVDFHVARTCALLVIGRLATESAEAPVLWVPERRTRRQRRSRATWSEWRRGLFEAQEGLCGCCGGEMPSTALSFDHVVPLNRLGPDTLDNILLAHPWCNSEKGDRLPTEEEIARNRLKNERLALFSGRAAIG